ncbi:MAG: NfeD family protein, partial [Clostridia bacterium]|nr:NfeD family protein [Clostridia bacterium]
VLVAAEMVIPGVSYLGIGGAIFVVLAIILLANSLLQAAIWIAAALTLIAILIFCSELLTHRLFGKNTAGIEKGYIPIKIDERLIGKIGVAKTDINPKGVLTVNGGNISVCAAEGRAVLKGEKAIIAGINAGIVFVERAE